MSNLKPIAIHFGRLTSLALLLLVLTSCALNNEIKPNNYYILDYNANFEKPELKQAKPFPVTLQVNEAAISRAYERNQIVVKYSFSRISYLQHDLWASKLYESITNLVLQRIQRYNIFQRADSDFLGGVPTYEMDITVNSMERLDYANNKRAHLALTFNFRGVHSEKVIFTHTADVEKVLYDDRVETLVVSLNDLLMQETDAFCAKVIRYLQTGSPVDSTATALAKAELNADLTPTNSEATNQFEGSQEGELLLPALTDYNTEPLYRVYDKNENEVATGVMGQVLTLPNGDYTISYGSDQKMMMDVHIFPNYRQIVKPEWGALVVNIIDEGREPVRLAYEVFQFRDDFVTSYGTDYSRSDIIGEDPTTWLLPAGQYKVTINGASYYTYKDFATVNIEPGQVNRLSIVVNSEHNMVGAGNILAENELASSKAFKFSNSINASFSLTYNNNDNRNNPQQSYSMKGEFDNRLNYDVDPHHYTTRSFYDLEFTKFSGSDFRVTVDEYSIKNTYIYDFLKRIGLYTRVDATSHFFNQVYLFGNPSNVLKYDKNGVLQDSLLLQDDVPIKPSFLPLNLREGIGVNYRMLQTLGANVNLRAGFGWQQVFSKNTYTLTRTVTDTTSTGELRVFQVFDESPSVYSRGIESSLISTLQFPSIRMSLTSSADFLFPLEKGKATTMRFENIVSFSIIRNVSLDFRINLTYDKTIKDYLVQDYRSYLRVSWFY
jgi:ABC-type uncharacterized transport system auxiliary subunit